VREKKPKPVGRPSFPKGKAKNEILKMRVLESEKKRYVKAAEAAGKDLSSWARETLNRCIQEPPRD
jgi:predicted HicB family RNase H-like nuclease